MPFNIFNHKNGRARRPVPKKHHHKKLVISEIRGEKALIHSESLVLDTQLFHFTAAAIKSFVCYGCIFLCAQERKKKNCVYGIMLMGSWTLSAAIWRRRINFCCHNFCVNTKKEIFTLM